MKEFSSKSKSKITYPNLDSARKPVSHDASMPVLLPPLGDFQSVPDEVEDSAGEWSSTDSSDSAESKYEPEKSSKPIPFSQKRLNATLYKICFFPKKVRSACIKIKNNQLA